MSGDGAGAVAYIVGILSFIILALLKLIIETFYIGSPTSTVIILSYSLLRLIE
ncbi:MAG: hypothetical protein U0354_02730 [Candidatus Sericytochromatia bacterium]